MKLTEKEFNKLPQLDRIEFRQKYDFIWNRFEGPGLLFKIIILGFMATSFMIITNLLFLIKFDSMIWSWTSLDSMINLYIFFMIIGFVVDLSFALTRSNKIKKLEKDYFKVKAKEKKK